MAAAPVIPRLDVHPVDAPPTKEELWEDYDRAIEKMVPLEIKSRRLSEKEEE